MTVRLSNINMILLWISITSVSPFVFFGIPGHPYKILTLLCMFLMFLQLTAHPKVNIDKTIIFILALQGNFFLFMLMYHQDIAYLRLFLQILSIIIIYIFIQTYLNIEKLAKSILIVMSAMGIGGFIIFLLAAINIVRPISVFLRPGTTYENIYNYIITFTNSVHILGDVTAHQIFDPQIIRVAGYFGEPSEMVLFIVSALSINKLLHDNRKFEIALLFTGIFTFSVGFYILSTLYFILFYFNRKNLKIFIAIFLIIILASFTLFHLKDTNDIFSLINKLTLERLSISSTEGRFIEGDSRSGAFISGFSYFKEAPFLGFGETFGREGRRFVVSTIMSIFIFNGFFGVFFVFLHVIYFFMMPFIFKMRNMPFDFIQVKVAFLLVLNYVVTPIVLSLFPYIIIIILIHLAKQRYLSREMYFNARV